jgi:hypothetical protein
VDFVQVLFLSFQASALWRTVTTTEDITVTRILILILASLGLALSGCFSSSSNSSRISASVPVGPGEPTADIRVLHASSDAPAVDIYIDDTRAISGLAFAEATSFTAVPARSLAVAIRAAGAPADSEPVFSATITPAADASYTLVAYGLLAGGEGPAFDVLVIDDMVDTPAASFARLFVLHAAPGVGPVDVYTQPGDSLGDPLLEDFLPSADTGDYLEVPAGTYRIRITPAGASTVAYDSGDITLESGLSYFVAALDRESGLAPASLIALLNDPAFVRLEDQRALVRALHLSPDAPTVDVLVNGEPVGVTLSFTDVSPYLTVLAGNYTLGVAPEDSTTAVASLDVEVEAGKAYSVLATGLLGATGDQAFALRPLEDQRQPAEGDNVLVRVIHASPDAPAVDVLANGGILGGLAGVPYFTASEYLTVAAGTYDLEVRPAGGAAGSAVISLPATDLTAGSIYTVIAAGLLAQIQPVLVIDP